MTSSLLVYQLGQARIWFAMSRDGLLPRAFAQVHRRFRTPHISTWVAGFFVGIPAGIFDIGELADLSNIGTLFAFLLVAVGVLVLRRKQPERQRGFRVPWVPVVPLAAIFFCVLLMASLPTETWLRFVVWLVIGLGIYFGYSRHRSEFAEPSDQ
jgi:basic amino acid/polyamine antiporter, APA family